MLDASVSVRGAVRTSAPPARVGRFQLLETLGRGGMGVVYRARDEASGKIVALKQLSWRAPASNRKTIEALFEREYHTLARLKHPCIIDVYEFERTREGPFYTMELLSGHGLRELAPLRYAEACRHVRDVASSLALLHARRLIHRDVSPGNVRLSETGRAKLLDFGALATFGAREEVIGTPPCVAPELLDWMPLDQRTDLFALGALCYYALTGTHAYPARRLEDLPDVWTRAPAPPSALVVGIPVALDELVLSLLSLDRLARPMTAAAVIERLNQIGNLEPESVERAAESYVLSSPMVGRELELERARPLIAKAQSGQGAALLVEGPSGIGRSRLLSELGLEAQLAGMKVLRAQAKAGAGAYAVVQALVASLLQGLPEAALAAARPHVSVLGHLVPALCEGLPEIALQPLPDDVGELRARLRTALHAWFCAIAGRQPLAIAVDDLHSADEDSAVFLAALAREARKHALLVLTTRPTSAPSGAPDALKLLQQASEGIKLPALSAGACADLVQGVFGDVSNAPRLGMALHERSAGNPRHCLELIQRLVQRRVVRYVDGSWVLPSELAAEELPSRLSKLLQARRAGLTPLARELSEVLAVHARPLPIERCLTLVGHAGQEHVLRALEELVAEEMLVCENHAYRFCYEAMREAALEHVDADKRRAMSLKLGEVLLASAGQDPRLELEAAWHLLRGGETTRAADLLARCGRQLIAAPGVENEAGRAARALEAAIEVYDRERRSDYELTAVLLPLMLLAFYTDWRLAPRYGVRALELGFRVSGLSLALRLRRLLGKKLAVVVAVLFASFRFRMQNKSRLDYGLREAIVGTFSAVASIVGVLSVLLDKQGVERVLRMVEPLTLFGDHHVAYAIHQCCAARVLLVSGRECEAQAVLERNIARFDDPRFAADLAPARRKAICAGEQFTLAVLRTYQFGDDALRAADEFDTLGIRMWQMMADQLRLIHHTARGETERARAFREKTELHVVQGGTSWQTDIFMPAQMLLLTFLLGDVVTARECWEQLARRAKEIPSLEIYAEAAHAAYLALRGNLPAAITRYEQVLSRLPPRERIGWISLRMHYAEMLNLAGEHAKAKQSILEALRERAPGDAKLVLTYGDLERHLALAEAGLGNYAEAVRILDDRLATHRDQGQPLLEGLLHKARAQVALAAGDREAFDRHFGLLEACFRSTQNPVLIAQCARLAQEAVRAGVRELDFEAERTTKPASLPPHTAISRQLRAYSVPEQRWDYAVRAALAQSGARAAHLYLVRAGRLELVAAEPAGEPSEAISAELASLVESARLEDAAKAAADSALARTVDWLGDGADPEHDSEHGIYTQTVPGTCTERHMASHWLLVLCAWRGEKRVVVGGLVLELLDAESGPNLAYFESIGQALYEAGDISVLGSRPPRTAP